MQSCVKLQKSLNRVGTLSVYPRPPIDRAFGMIHNASRRSLFFSPHTASVVLPEPGLQPAQQGTDCAGCQGSRRRGLHRGLYRGTGPHAAAGWNLPGMTVRLRLCSLQGTHTASSHLGCTYTNMQSCHKPVSKSRLCVEQGRKHTEEV